MHVTFVVPTEIGAPLEGVHATDTGAVPPVTTGGAYVTVVVRPLAGMVWSAGQEILGPPEGLVGPVGFSLQPAAKSTATTRARAYDGD